MAWSRRLLGLFSSYLLLLGRPLKGADINPAANCSLGQGQLFEIMAEPLAWSRTPKVGANSYSPLPDSQFVKHSILVRTNSIQGSPSESQTPRHRSKLISSPDPLLSEARCKDSSYCWYE